MNELRQLMPDGEKEQDQMKPVAYQMKPSEVSTNEKNLFSLHMNVFICTPFNVQLRILLPLTYETIRDRIPLSP